MFERFLSIGQVCMPWWYSPYQFLTAQGLKSVLRGEVYGLGKLQKFFFHFQFFLAIEIRYRASSLTMISNLFFFGQ